MNQITKEIKQFRIAGSVFYIIAFIMLIVAYFYAMNVYRMWVWPSTNADLVEIIIEQDSDGYPSFYGEIKFEAEGVVYLASLDDPIDESYQKGDKIKISYNPDNPSKVLKFSFFFSFTPFIWIAVAGGLMYIGRLVWNYKGK